MNSSGRLRSFGTKCNGHARPGTVVRANISNHERTSWPLESTDEGKSTTAKRRGRKGGRSPAPDPERVEQIVPALDGGASKASVWRSFKVPRSTLLDILAGVGWTGPAGAKAEPGRRTTERVRKAAAKAA